MPVLPVPLPIAVQAPRNVATTAATCATADMSTIAPGDLLQKLDDFRSSLNRRDRARVDQALSRPVPAMPTKAMHPARTEPMSAPCSARG
jgi:hypothetical protein